MNLLNDQSKVIRSLHNTIEGLNITIKGLNDKIERMEENVKNVKNVDVDVNADVNKNVSEGAGKEVSRSDSNKVDAKNIHSKNVHEKVKKNSKCQEIKMQKSTLIIMHYYNLTQVIPR